MLASADRDDFCSPLRTPDPTTLVVAKGRRIRIRRCSNAAQLHWPRLFLASDGFARLEINYARIIGFNKNWPLFLYVFDRQLWGQWDTGKEFLQRYKTRADRRNPGVGRVVNRGFQIKTVD
jgi:hypothetical protein